MEPLGDRRMAAQAVLALLLAGCSTVQDQWHDARRQDSIAAYESFLRQHPRCSMSSRAQSRLAELRTERNWQAAREENTIISYQRFLRQHPRSEFSDQARAQLAKLKQLSRPAGVARDRAGIDEALVEAGRKRARDLEANPIPAYTRKDGTIAICAGAAFTVRNGRTVLVDGDMVYNVGAKRMAIGGVALATGEAMVIREGRDVKLSRSLKAVAPPPAQVSRGKRAYHHAPFGVRPGMLGNGAKCSFALEAGKVSLGAASFRSTKAGQELRFRGNWDRDVGGSTDLYLSGIGEVTLKSGKRSVLPLHDPPAESFGAAVEMLGSRDFLERSRGAWILGELRDRQGIEVLRNRQQKEPHFYARKYIEQSLKYLESLATEPNPGS